MVPMSYPMVRYPIPDIIVPLKFSAWTSETQFPITPTALIWPLKSNLCKLKLMKLSLEMPYSLQSQSDHPSKGQQLQLHILVFWDA